MPSMLLRRVLSVIAIASVLAPAWGEDPPQPRGFDEPRQKEFDQLPEECRQKCGHLFQAWKDTSYRAGKAQRAVIDMQLQRMRLAQALEQAQKAGAPKAELERLQQQIDETVARKEELVREASALHKAVKVVKQDFLECLEGCDLPGGFNPAWLVIPTIVGGGAAVALTNGDEDPKAPATPPVAGPAPTPIPSNPPPVPPPPSSINAQVLVIEAGGTRVLNGTATGPMNGTNHQTLHRQTNNCNNYFFPNFPVELRVTGTGGPATGLAEATADGNFMIDGTPITAHIVVGVNVPGGKPIVKTYELGKRQSGVMCTDAFMP
jgi:hypothetical protein